MKKQGKIVVTKEVLEQALHLKEGISIIGIEMDSIDRNTYAVYVQGDSLQTVGEAQQSIVYQQEDVMK
ncbi:hypothetical protein TCA2_4505 [Paenibacillus sp. TCA20]|uniref:Uncharacterized protein n=1 Tax=Paenibacillus urinalis TaxID=521520 RepID=A0ABY7XH77_9BACL|nr:MULTISPECIES: hypothetical protein [Paenibacillus]WDI05161.1 hypothetical protein PUW25_25470 [Paenibacillus urinalis]GAK42013.1 hypothetical protein TCA2_4505 [Paenibacillus sp. TCA20]